MSTTEQAIVIPIQFLTGALSGQIAGSIPDHGTAEFSVQAQAGQKMVVNLIPLSAGLALTGTVKFPNGGQTGGPGGVVMSQVAPASGSYVITVATSNMAGDGQGGNFVVEVILLPEWLTFQS